MQIADVFCFVNFIDKKINQISKHKVTGAYQSSALYLNAFVCRLLKYYFRKTGIFRTEGL